jgi:hypothetical protein
MPSTPVMQIDLYHITNFTKNAESFPNAGIRCAIFSTIEVMQSTLGRQPTYTTSQIPIRMRNSFLKLAFDVRLYPTIQVMQSTPVMQIDLCHTTDVTKNAKFFPENLSLGVRISPSFDGEDHKVTCR